MDLAVNDRLIHRQLTEKIIGAAMEVHRTLGDGFLEKVYENALVLELRNRGLNVEQQKPINVLYKGEVVGEYIADVLVDGLVLIELKTVEKLTSVHQAQVLHYLKATSLRVGLLINFSAPSLEFRRLVL